MLRFCCDKISNKSTYLVHSSTNLSLNYNHQRPPIGLHQLKLSSQGPESDHQSQKTDRFNVYGDLMARKEENIYF